MKEMANHLILIKEKSQIKDAILNCEAMQGHLFIPTNDSELDILGHLLESSSVSCQCAPGKTCAYIGGKKTDSSEVNTLGYIMDDYFQNCSSFYQIFIFKQ